MNTFFLLIFRTKLKMSLWDRRNEKRNNLIEDRTTYDIHEMIWNLKKQSTKEQKNQWANVEKMARFVQRTTHISLWCLQWVMVIFELEFYFIRKEVMPRAECAKGKVRIKRKSKKNWTPFLPTVEILNEK